MADTDTETLPNGTGALSEEDERLKQRPADIDADVREMERRKRVEALMSSKLFREELERVLDQQLHEGGDAPLLQRIKEMVGGRLHTGTLRGPTCVLPINDIRGIEGVGYEKGEKILRCKLAAVYRLVDLFGWTQTGINGQITARLNTAVEQVLTTPRGLLPHEVTASSLVKVDMQGVVQDQGTTNFPVNVEGFSLHGAVHAARPDVRCVLHVRSPAALAVSAMKRGLLPLCTEAALVGDVAYHSVPSGLLDNEEQEKLVRALGPHAKVLMLTSGGALCCGQTLEEAFYQARNLTAACDVQLRLASVPVDELALMPDAQRKQIYEASRKPPSEHGKWRAGGEEFEALMRMLDNAGFRTGYIYRNPLIKNDVPKPKNDVEVPPAVSSLGYLLEEEELYRQGLWKKGTGVRGERTRWLNSPNVYQKVEVLETGTPDPRKITKWVDANNEEWVQEASPAHSSTPVKIDTLQFVPKNTNPKEFKALQQQIKDNRRADKISAGPQSHILEGVSWDEAARLVGEDAANTHTGDHVVLMGAASKGIIQRGYQHNATVYSAPYARNPFDHVSDREIDEYRRCVERKQRNDYDTDLSESEALSAAQLTSPASARTDTEDESRDEHRVLRIETKQAPVRSQPEVVLSDDFLNAERAHADRTKAQRDPNLLSDDEVFYDSPVSAVTSPVPVPFVIRSSHAPVKQTVGGKTPETNTITLTEALSTSKRNVHDYSRTANLEHTIKKFDSIENINTETLKHPKCKISLTAKMTCDALELLQPGPFSSRSSLRSIPSIEWDGRCKSDYGFRTRSLPRQRKNSSQRLYRTQSHSGFINFAKDPEPTHFHLPRCRSCGATNTSYTWELSKDTCRRKTPHSLYMSVDNLPQRCIEESKANAVKVSQKIVPVFKIAKLDNDFVESQEFTEDNYLGDLNSFSSHNQTVIENTEGSSGQDVTVTEVTVKNDTKVAKTDNDDAKEETEDDLYRAECVPVVENRDEINNNYVDSVEGEYHSFSDDMGFDEAVYDSPVKELVEKDIRDYTVPIDCYCEDYKKDSPGKSPQKRLGVEKPMALEPILEESKSSYDDSGNMSGEKTELKCDKETSVEAKDFDLHTCESENFAHYVVQDLFNRVEAVVDLKIEISDANFKKVSTDALETKYVYRESYFAAEEESDVTSNETESVKSYVQTAMDVHCMDEEEVDHAIVDCVYNNVFELLSRGNSLDCNLSSTVELKSFDSTAEFEKYEVIADVVTSILNQIDFQGDNRDVYVNLPKEHVGGHFDEQKSLEIVKEPQSEEIVILKATNTTDQKVAIQNQDSITDDNKEQCENVDEIKSIGSNEVEYHIPDFKNENLVKTDEKTKGYVEFSMAKFMHTLLENDDEANNSNEFQFDSVNTTNDSENYSSAEAESFLILTNENNDEQKNLEVVKEPEKAEMDILKATNSATDQNVAIENKENEPDDETYEHAQYETVDEMQGFVNNEDIQTDFDNENKVKTDEKPVGYVEFSMAKFMHTLLEKDDDSNVPNEVQVDKVDMSNDSENYSSAEADSLLIPTNEKNDVELMEHNENNIDLDVNNQEMIHILHESDHKNTLNNDSEQSESVEEENNNTLPITEEFSIAKIIQEIELDVNLNETVLTEASDTELSHAHKVVESVLYYIFDKIFFTLNDKEKALKEVNKKVVTVVVDAEDILLTASPALLGHVQINKSDFVPEEKVFNSEQIVFDKDRQLEEIEICLSTIVKEQDDINCITVETIATNHETIGASQINEQLHHMENNTNVEKNDTNAMVTNFETELHFHCENIEILQNTTTLDKEFTPALSDMDLDIIGKTNNTPEMENCTLDQHDKGKIEASLNTEQANIFDKEIDYTDSNVLNNNKEHIVQLSGEEISSNLDTFAASMPEVIECHDAPVAFHQIEQADPIETFEVETDANNIIKSEMYTPYDDKSTIDNFEPQDIEPEGTSDVTIHFDEYESLRNVSIEDYNEVTTFNETTIIDVTFNDSIVQGDDFNTASQDIQDESIEVAAVIITGITDGLEHNMSDEACECETTAHEICECETNEEHLNETFILENKNTRMNTAFLEYSRSSSPNRETSILEVCTESPIRNPSDTFIGDDLSVLYEKDDTLLGSPFVKQASVISMSQTVHSGGIKYWVSFDDSLNDVKEKPSFKSVRRSKENNFPSFLTVDFNNKEEEKSDKYVDAIHKDIFKPRSVLNFNQSDDSHLKLDDGFRSFNQSHPENSNVEESFATCTSTDYQTCESGANSKLETSNFQKKLLYDSRTDLHTNVVKRQHASWPPFEETLFYRIISKFRMSESFDPSDFEHIQIDNSF